MAVGRPPGDVTDDLSRQVPHKLIEVALPLDAFVSAQQQAGQRLDLDELLVLSYVRDHSEISGVEAARLLQRPEAATQNIHERLVLQPEAWLERRGETKEVT